MAHGSVDVRQVVSTRAWRASLIAGLAAILVVALPATQASAALTIQQVRWTGCSWGWHTTPSGPITVLTPPVDTPGGFRSSTPASDTGARQSFHELLRQAVNEWAPVVRNSGTLPGLSLVWGSKSPSDITFLPQDNVEGGYLGWTYVYTTGGNANGKGNCPVGDVGHSVELQKNIRRAEIKIETDDYWFTQYGNTSWGASARTNWENCPANSVSYTCLKDFDFGSVAVHELGHALGLVHPDDADRDFNRTSAPAKAANCRNTASLATDQASMCREIFFHRTDMRTLYQSNDYDRLAYEWLGSMQ